MDNLLDLIAIPVALAVAFLSVSAAQACLDRETGQGATEPVPGVRTPTVGGDEA